jgi:DNA-binding PucR family transcriptional regulator
MTIVWRDRSKETTGEEYLNARREGYDKLDSAQAAYKEFTMRMEDLLFHSEKEEEEEVYSSSTNDNDLESRIVRLSKIMWSAFEDHIENDSDGLGKVFDKKTREDLASFIKELWKDLASDEKSDEEIKETITVLSKGVSSVIEKNKPSKEDGGEEKPKNPPKTK